MPRIKKEHEKLAWTCFRLKHYRVGQQIIAFTARLFQPEMFSSCFDKWIQIIFLSRMGCSLILYSSPNILAGLQIDEDLFLQIDQS